MNLFRSIACSRDVEVMRSLNIDRTLAEENKKNSKKMKLLLLGTAECGKSTVLKQMKIMNSGALSEEELRAGSSLVRSNMLRSMGILLEALNQFSIPLNSELDEALLRGDDGDLFTRELADALKSLWANMGIQRCFEMRNQFQLPDSAKYYLDSVERITAANYVPNQDDMLRCRAATTGIVEVHFNMRGMDFLVFDVGGQRSERKKWIHAFEGVNAIIYISAISEYDQVLAEDNITNRLDESIRLFAFISSLAWFQRTSMILFLNKKDLFSDKIKSSPMGLYFKEYEGSDEYQECVNFVREKFSALKGEQQKLFVHETCATDTDQVQKVLSSVITTIISENLSGGGMA